MQSFSLHWIMQNIWLFNVSEALNDAKMASIRHSKGNKLHYPVQAKHLNLNSNIYILYHK